MDLRRLTHKEHEMRYAVCLLLMLLVVSGCPSENEPKEAPARDDRVWIEVGPRVQREKSPWGHGDNLLNGYFEKHAIKIHKIRRTSRGAVCRGLNCPTETKIEILVDKESLPDVYKAVPYLKAPLQRK